MNIRLPLRRKMILFLIPTALFVFGGALGYITFQERNRAIEDTKQLANITAEKYANEIKTELNIDANIARGVAQSIHSFSEISEPDRTRIYKKSLWNVLKGNSQMLSFWLFFELNAIDPNYNKEHGRVGLTYYRDQFNNIKFSTDTLDTGENIGLSYSLMKKSKEETVLEPYTYSYTGSASDEILETSICIPILKNGDFVGLMGADLSLDRYSEILDEINVGEGSFGYLLSNKGALIAHPDEEILGTLFSETFPAIDKQYSVTQNIENGRAFSYLSLNNDKEEFYYAYVPFVIGETITPWSLAVCVPFKSIKEKATHALLLSLIIGFIGLLVLSLIIFLIANSITNPLKQATSILSKLSEGEIDSDDELKINTGDEIEEIANSVNQLIVGLNRTSEFAKTIGQGNLSADYQKSGDNDVLGNSLLEMRQSLIVAEEEEKKRKIKDDMQNWATQGQAKFGEILRQHNQSIGDLSFNIMSNLVDYVDAIQGGVFVKNDDNDEEIVFELTGSIAFDRQKTLEQKFKIGESLIGRCAFEKLTIYMEEVPEDYVHVTSGLGQSNPRSILIVPAILNEEVYAIIELVSFNKFEPHQIEFIEKIGESIASTIANARVNARTNKLLEQSKQQSEELAAQEEEMRQNLEELQATQEEVARIREEDQAKNQKLIDEVDNHRVALKKILDYIPAKIFLKDAEGKMLIVNKKLLDAHNMQETDIIGKSDFDFFDDYNKAKTIWDAEQALIKSGNSKHEVYEEKINNSGIILDSMIYPFYIDYLNETGILGVQMDITENVKKGEIIDQLKEEIEKLKK